MVLAAAALLCSLTGSGEAASARTTFPGWVVAQAADEVEIALDANGVDALRAHGRVVLEALPWGAGIDLELERCPGSARPGALFVDGRPAGRRAGERATFWSGRVAGEPRSDVFLAFAGGALWGWVQREGELVHFLPGPDAAGSWLRGTTRLVGARALHRQGWRFDPRCVALEPSADAPRTLADEAAGPLLPYLLFGTLAVETDWQFYQLFGDLAVAEGYVLSLLAAANVRFRTQVGVHLEVSYLGFHTSADDPWRTHDGGGNCIDALYEFQAAWGGGAAPVPSDLHHMLSGADLGCGAGFIDALCDPQRGFSITSRIDGRTPFPVAPGPLNWDFVWMCHELGHNFGSVHTHQYCPPLDECSPPGYWGDCQDEMACITNGTMMSYCHACPGGMANFTTWFHPVVAGVMRAASQASCFGAFLRR